MSVIIGDIRYRAVCIQCGKSIGDWALHVPKEKRLCWDHQKHTIQKDTQYFKKRAEEVG